MEKLLKPLLALVGALIVSGSVWLGTSNETLEGPAVAPSRGLIERAYADGRSSVMVEASGKVAAVLPDDLSGSRHQRLIVELASGHTVLIAHNIDLAPRIPAPRKGAAIRFRGEYEWNQKGGVVHWTHKDPIGKHDDGWLEFDGARYW